MHLKDKKTLKINYLLVKNIYAVGTWYYLKRQVGIYNTEITGIWGKTNSYHQENQNLFNLDDEIICGIDNTNSPGKKL